MSKPAAACRNETPKPFIVDVPANLLKRNAGLSKAARALYSTMRSLADGKTGALKIRDRWLEGKAIDAAAEMCRDVRMRAMRELVAVGLATVERERVRRMIGGRKRVVFGAVHYFVHRQSVRGKNAKNGPFLLKSISSTVEKIDSQFLSSPPIGARGVGSVVSPAVSNEKRKPGHHHHQQSSKPDDDSTRVFPSEEKPSSDSLSLLRAKAEEALSRKYDPELVGIALDHILERIVEHGEPIGSVNYILKAFENIWASTEYDEVFDEFQNRKLRRERFMPGFTGELTPEQEEQRRAFNARLAATQAQGAQH